MQSIRSLLKVRSTDPKDARRRRMLNILLAGAASLSVLTLLLALVVGIASSERAGATLTLALAGGMLLLGSIVLFAWLSARNLEQALDGLRTANQELDQRVAERTEALEKANERLRELDKLKTSFVALISHELRTPLNAIMGYADMLHQGVYGPLSAQQQDANDRVIANVRHLSGIVNDLLDRAQIQAGTISLHPEHFVPEELVEHLRDTLGPLAEARGLAFDTRVAEDLPSLLYGDRRRVEQILTNLIQNSIKFTERGSVSVHMYRSGDQGCTIAVADTGPGIPEEAQDLVFEPFSQLDNSETREHGGAGLGLSIAKHLAVMMGGDIKLQSEVGRGSTFSVALPLVPLQAQGKDPT